MFCYVLYFHSLPPFLLYRHTRTSLLVHPPPWAETPALLSLLAVISAARADLLVVMGGVNIWVLLKSSHPSPALSARWHTFRAMLPKQGFHSITCITAFCMGTHWDNEPACYVDGGVESSTANNHNKWLPGWNLSIFLFSIKQVMVKSYDLLCSVLLMSWEMIQVQERSLDSLQTYWEIMKFLLKVRMGSKGVTRGEKDRPCFWVFLNTNTEILCIPNWVAA